MLAYAFFMLLTRYLAAYDAPLVMLFYSILLGTFALAPFAIWQWVWPQTPGEWLLLAVPRRARRHRTLSVHPRLPTGAGVQTVAPFLYMQLLTMVAFGFAVFGDVPDVWTLVGAGGDRRLGHLSPAPRAPPARRSRARRPAVTPARSAPMASRGSSPGSDHTQAATFDESWIPASSAAMTLLQLPPSTGSS